jgi:hypothetical protein
MRFDEMIRPGMTVREVRQQYPQTAEIFAAYGFRPSCDDCSIELVCRKHGLRSADVVAELNESVFAAARR